LYLRTDGATHTLLDTQGNAIAQSAKVVDSDQQDVPYLLTHFVPMLKARGVSEPDIDVMLRENPRRLLAGKD